MESVGRTKSRLQRAQKIMSWLSGETIRWIETAANLWTSSQFILSDFLFISGVFTYLHAFSPSFRVQIIDQWKKFLNEEEINFSENFTIEKELVIHDWIVKWIPNDTYSI